MYGMNTNTTLVLNFISLNPGVTERDIAKRYFAGRVLPARQLLQAALWAGTLVPHRAGYRLHRQATTARLEALPVSDLFYAAYAAF